jgi:MFS family permease
MMPAPHEGGAGGIALGGAWEATAATLLMCLRASLAKVVLRAAGTTVVPYKKQQYRHYSILAAGLIFLAMTILTALLGPIAGWLAARISTTPVMVTGLLVAAAGS